MKITMYELLGMIKDGKAPKRIKYGNVIYKKMNIDNYEAEDFNIKLFDYNFFQESRLNDEVEIIEEEKKIPEKLNYQYRNLYGRLSQHKQSEIDIIDTLNGVIDYLKSKGE